MQWQNKLIKYNQLKPILGFLAVEWLYPELVIGNMQMESAPIKAVSSSVESVDSGRDGVALEILNNGRRSRQTDNLHLDFYT